VHVKLPFGVVAVAYGISILAAVGYCVKSKKGHKMDSVILSRKIKIFRDIVRP
jgi:hypothetical protein